MPGDVVNRATADLPDEQRSTIRRMHAYFDERSLSLNELAEKVGLSTATVSTVFRGKYGADLTGVVATFNRFLALEERRASAPVLEFIKVELSETIWGVCDSALEMQRIAVIIGRSQIGKSESLRAYQREHNHGSTIYVSVPAGGGPAEFRASLAGKLRISPHQRRIDLRRRIIESFDSRMLLIVDEAHQCLPMEGSTRSRGIQTLEFIREIFDETHCGLVYSGTDVFRAAMENGPLVKLLEQTKRRSLGNIILPETPSRRDLNTFAARYGLKPSEGESRELENLIVDRDALGMWLTLLRMGAKLAAKDKTKLSWSHVLRAYADKLKWETKKR